MTRPRPSFALLHRYYRDRFSVTIDELYQEIGYPEYASSPYWHNTCAVRVSLALVAAGVAIHPGHLTIKAGRWAGKRIEQSQKRLAAFLADEWGAPETFGRALAQDGIGMRRGVVSFSRLWSPYDPQGHIDLIAPDQWHRLMCEGSCYWEAVEVAFWPLE